MTRSSWPTTSRHARGYGTAWDRLSKAVLKRDNYLCQCSHCKRAGRITAASECDHVVSKARAKVMGWSDARIDHPDNLAAINVDCHKRKTIEEKGGKRRPKIGLDGYPVASQ